MGTNNRPPGQAETSPATHRLLATADYFLRDRKFSDSRNYALRARDSDSTHPSPTAILAVAAVLSAPTISSTRRDYYAVFGVPHFEPDVLLIRYRFRNLASNLNPSVNPYPFADEALELVQTAWSVLSNPKERSRFDEELRTSLSPSNDDGNCSSGNDTETFWTICPYCYYVYEFERAYEECCVRCSNEKCRRVLHAVAIGGPPPPPDIIEKGQYMCAGFMNLGISEELGEKSWSPFEPQVLSADQNAASNRDGAVIDVSDVEIAGIERVKTVRKEFPYLSHGKRMNFDFKGRENVEETKELNGEGRLSVKDIGFVERSVEKGRRRSRKSVLLNSKKLMGRGVEMDEDQANLIYKFGESGDSIVTRNDEEVLELEAQNRVKFFEGGDDVFIGLHCDFDDLGDEEREFLKV